MNDAQLRSMITMGKVAGTKVGPHTLMQITGLDGVSQQTVLLLLPPGYSARPSPGSDLALLQVLGSGDHVIGLGGAQENHVIADLASGECGLWAFENQLVMRSDHLEVTTTGSMPIDLSAGGAINQTAGGRINLTASIGAINMNAPDGVQVNGVAFGPSGGGGGPIIDGGNF
jgi:phage gp45-like